LQGKGSKAKSRTKKGKEAAEVPEKELWDSSISDWSDFYGGPKQAGPKPASEAVSKP
jgi:hypothetical protein